MQQDSPDIDILVKYLLGECSEQERLRVEHLKQENPGLHQQLAESGHVLKLVQAHRNSEAMNVEEEWALLKANISIEAIQQRPPVVRLLKKLAVAAAVITVLLTGGYLILGSKKQYDTIAVVAPPQQQNLAAFVTHINNSDSVETIVLPDGSRVILERGSEIGYPGVFTQQALNIILNGQARFQVVKNKLRPFMVSSQGLTTRVLGTVFDVDARKTSGYILVKLYQGKISVKPTSTSEEVLLDPGFQLLYNKQTFTAKVTRFAGNKKPVNNSNTPSLDNGDHLNMPVAKSSWYMFNNEPVKKVFDHLAEMYKTKISYKEEDLRRLHFIGEFNRSDSIEMILKQITDSYNLQLSKTDEGYRISKP
jgi:ferric-dicitrate binding protein FerR (iron transport regulator)